MAPTAAQLTSSTTVQVVAPMNLQEGYQLEVLVHGNEKKFIAIPPGGVKEGQTFTAQILNVIPMNDWRDGLCDCFKYGCCHAMCWLGWCFLPILVGQVMTRMSRDFCGGPGPSPAVSNTCMIVTSIWLVYVAIQVIFSIIMETQACIGGKVQLNLDTYQQEIHCPDGSIETPTSAYMALRYVGSFFGVAFAIYIIVTICRTRQAIREKYNIPPGCCGQCEDCCCAYWCSCCTVEQMARHTNDYSTYDVACCSKECCNKRGQKDTAPEGQAIAQIV